MRDFKGMKRQRGRNRGSGGGGGNIGKPQHNANRSFDSNGPEGIKVRGAAQGVFEKYQQLARDAQTGGDRVLAENYLQHAEHYYRVLRAMQPTRNPSEFISRDGFSSGLEIDFEAEPEEAVAEAPEVEGEDQNAGQGSDGGERQEFRREGQRDDRPRYNNDRPREDRQREYRDDRPRDGQRDDRPRYNNDRPRDDRPRDDRSRDDRQRARLERQERYDRERGERPAEAVVESSAPREEPPSQPRLRGQDGAISEAPAFLSRGAAEPRADVPVGEEGAAPRKRGRPRKTPVE